MSTRASQQSGNHPSDLQRSQSTISPRAHRPRFCDPIRLACVPVPSCCAASTDDTPLPAPATLWLATHVLNQSVHCQERISDRPATKASLLSHKALTIHALDSLDHFAYILRVRSDVLRPASMRLHSANSCPQLASTFCHYIPQITNLPICGQFLLAIILHNPTLKQLTSLTYHQSCLKTSKFQLN